MGCSIKFVRLDDFVSDVDVLDLSTGGYSLMNDGYFQVAAPIGAKSVHEVITLKLQGTSKDNLATLTQAVDAKIKQVQWWLENPGIERYQVWVRVQLDGETYSRQAQILNITPPDKVKVFTPMEIGANYLGEYQIGIERTPFWEGSISTPISKASVNALGGKQALTAGLAGDVPARMVRFRIYPTAGSSNVSAAWIGWKTSRFGTAANFVGNWKLNNGLYGLDTSAIADATAYTGFRVATTFSVDATLKMRTQVSVGNVSVTHPEDQRGTYLVLMRAKVSDSSIIRARIAGSFGLLYPVYRSRQVISGTSWQLYEMGVLKIPPSRTYTYHTLSRYMIEVDAERLSGAGELHVDCLCMIPIDDGAIKVTLPSSLSSAVDQKVAIFQAADGQINSWFESSLSNVYYSALVSPQNTWGIPNDSTAPIAVCAASDPAATGSTNGATVDFEYTYALRWRTLRGSAT